MTSSDSSGSDQMKRARVRWVWGSKWWAQDKSLRCIVRYLACYYPTCHILFSCLALPCLALPRLAFFYSYLSLTSHHITSYHIASHHITSHHLSSLLFSSLLLSNPLTLPSHFPSPLLSPTPPPCRLCVLYHTSHQTPEVSS